MRVLAFLAVLIAAAPMAACGTSRHDTTVIAQPGSTVVAPDGAKVVEH